MIIYIDAEYKCHVVDDGTMTPVETEFFFGNCQIFIEGYRLVPAGAEYNGKIAAGNMHFPWVDYRELEAAQIAYEREQYPLLITENADMKAELTAADMAYEEGVNSIYE